VPNPFEGKIETCIMSKVSWSETLLDYFGSAVMQTYFYSRVNGLQRGVAYFNGDRICAYFEYFLCVVLVFP